MADVKNWTDQQQQVIDAREGSLLVSAAAGSGKTAVLVERIITQVLDPDDPLDLDRLLVVTFTKAAASEMRERIRTRLEEALRQEPGREELRRQIALLPHARIATMHSFCMDVIRDHFARIGLDPNFRTADEGEAKLLMGDVMDAMLEDEYEQGSGTFLRFSQTFATGRTDNTLGDVILQLYRTSMAHPWPEEWRTHLLDDYDADPAESVWMSEMLRIVSLQMRDKAGEMERALRVCTMPGGPAGYEEGAMEALEWCRQWPGTTYEECRAYIRTIESWRRTIGRCGRNEADEQMKKRVSDTRTNIRNQIRKIRDRYFALDDQALRSAMACMRPVLAELVRLTDRFDQMYEQARRERGLIDYGDMEHLALQILVRREDGVSHPTEAALEYGRHFRWVYTDEYQDSNRVQEEILRSVSAEMTGGHNRFMVGDVKQSIYRFRQARPEIFMEKYRTYAPEGAERRITLSRNFRSRPEVLDTVNRIFAQIMSADLGGVDYDAEAALYPGATYPPCSQAKWPEAGDARTELILLTEPAGEEDEGNVLPGGDGGPDAEGPDRAEDAGAANGAGAGGDEYAGMKIHQEAVCVARKIRRLVGRQPVWDADLKSLRPARLGDITVLLRTMKQWSDVFMEVFARMGIPAWCATGTGYFDTVEIRTVLAVLNVLDNPRQDYPLAAALLSPVGGLTEEDLARICAASSQERICLWERCRAYAQPGSADDATYRKLSAFITQYESLRSKVPYTPIHELISCLLDETGYEDYVTAMPAGERRRANLRMLIEKAVTFENGSYRGLFHFLRYIENLQKYEIDQPEAPQAGAGSDAVRILSIHKSKGLEFPIVFLCGLAKQFNRTDVSANPIIHADLGLGCRYIDPERRVRARMMQRDILADMTALDAQGEELRVLYVAMTRAKEKLIMTGRVGNLARSMTKWLDQGDVPSAVLPYSVRSGASTFLDVIMPAVARSHCADECLETLGLQRLYEPDDVRDVPLRLSVELTAPVSVEMPAPAGSGRIEAGSEQAQAAMTEGGLTAAGSEKSEADLAKAGTAGPEDAQNDYERTLEALRERLKAFSRNSAYMRGLRRIPAKLSVSDLKHTAYEEAEEEILRWYGDVVPEQEEFDEAAAAVPADDNASQEGPVAGSSGETAAAADGADGGPAAAAADGAGKETAAPLNKRRGGLHGAELGTLCHRVMELLDMEAAAEIQEGADPEGAAGAFAQRELERLVKCDKISKDERESIDTSWLTHFLEDPLAGRMAAAAQRGRLYREMPFVLGVSARRINEEWDSDETVLIQGIIDAWFEEDDEIILVDYKTDRVYTEDGSDLIKKYRIQLDLYSQALERICGRKVVQKLIYSFRLGRTIEC